MPGATATNIYANSKVQMDMDGYAKCQVYQACMPPAVRTPDVVANAVCWLAGAENVTGAEIKVDGGWTVC